jgi:hypothetical protein
VAGRSKFADRMAKHLGEPIDSACPITNSAGGQMGASVGGVVGGVVSGVVGGKGGAAASDIQIGQFAWLGLGPERFAITNSSFSGKPTGDPLLVAAYGDVAAMDVTLNKLSLRAELGLTDGRTVVFEAKRQGTNKANAEVVAELKDRTTIA